MAHHLRGAGRSGLVADLIVGSARVTAPEFQCDSALL